MNRREFISGLREALELKASKGEIDSQVEYYNEYIRGEVKKGRSEADVVNDLGDPWAIAKNLGYDTDTVYEESVGSESKTTTENGYSGKAKVYSTNSTWVVWGVIFVVMAVLLMLMSFAMSVLNFLAPVLVPILLIVMVIRILGKR